MCLARRSTRATTPAPAPEPPAKPAEEQDILSPRKEEDKQQFGSSSPTLRVDRSVTSGGTGATGTGLRM